MAQFDVFVNPVASARAGFPFVVSMQSDLARNPREQIIAPVSVRGALGSGSLTPKIAIQGFDHIVFVPRLRVMESRVLTAYVCSVVSARLQLLAAIDLLFFGV
jgi:hypothetical protein